MREPGYACGTITHTEWAVTIVFVKNRHLTNVGTHNSYPKFRFSASDIGTQESEWCGVGVASPVPNVGTHNTYGALRKNYYPGFLVAVPNVGTHNSYL